MTLKTARLTIDRSLLPQKWDGLGIKFERRSVVAIKASAPPRDLVLVKPAGSLLAAGDAVGPEPRWNNILCGPQGHGRHGRARAGPAAHHGPADHRHDRERTGGRRVAALRFHRQHIKTGLLARRREEEAPQAAGRRGAARGPGRRLDLSQNAHNPSDAPPGLHALMRRDWPASTVLTPARLTAACDDGA